MKEQSEICKIGIEVLNNDNIFDMTYPDVDTVIYVDEPNKYGDYEFDKDRFVIFIQEYEADELDEYIEDDDGERLRYVLVDTYKKEIVYQEDDYSDVEILESSAIDECNMYVDNENDDNN